MSAVIVGPKNAEQLDDNLGAVDIGLDEEALRRLDEVSALPREYPQWMPARQSRGRLPEAWGRRAGRSMPRSFDRKC